MRALVQQWYTSEESQGDFAARHGVSRAKFRYWVGQLRRETSAGPVHFTPVQVVTGEGAMGVVEIALPNGTRVLVREGAPAALITHVLTALTAC
jgi:hypothetical protein